MIATVKSIIDVKKQTAQNTFDRVEVETVTLKAVVVVGTLIRYTSRCAWSGGSETRRDRDVTCVRVVHGTVKVQLEVGKL